MSEQQHARAIAITDDRKRMVAFIRRIRTKISYALPDDPRRPYQYPWTVYEQDASMEGPIRTTLGALRRSPHWGLPPARLKWKANEPIYIATLTSGGSGGNCGPCSARDLKRIATAGEAGLAGRIRWISKTEFPDIYFLCGYNAFESWSVGWHLIKADRVLQGGAYQRPSLSHNGRYVSIAMRWAGFCPGGSTLFSDWDYEPDDDEYEKLEERFWKHRAR